MKKNLKKEPEWYWSRGLHDAQVESIEEKELIPNYKEIMPLYNCLEMNIYAEGALFDSEVTKICFYNYKFKGFEANLPTEFPLFWMYDTLKQISEYRYEIEIVLVTRRNKHKTINMTFQTAVLERKS